jgi:hypothetical protein
MLRSAFSIPGPYIGALTQVRAPQMTQGGLKIIGNRKMPWNRALDRALRS